MSQENSGKNILDVTMDLLNIHLRIRGIDSPEELKQVYAEYYALVKRLGAKNGKNLSEFLPKDINDKLKE